MISSFGEAILPATDCQPPFGTEVARRLESFFSQETPSAMLGAVLFRSMLQVIEQSSRLRYLRPASRLPVAERLAHFQSFWQDAAAPKRFAFRLFAAVIKTAYYADPAITAKLGVDNYPPEIVQSEKPRWWRQVLHSRDITDDLELEAEMVVLGTGAGGAAVAHALARRGNAVVMIEAGDYFTREQFTGRPLAMQQMMYANSGIFATLGNVSIMLQIGVAVGGTTTINSGTCFRPPPRTLRNWRNQLGLVDYTPAALEPYFDEVEAVFRVETARLKDVGANGEIVARGAEALGYRHGPLQRNAPDCDGQGVCSFGCPTGAKRSCDVSFVPAALESNAQLLCRVKVDEILLENGRAAGLRGRSRDTGRRVTVKAPIVVLAGGALSTPLLLMKHKLGKGSGQLGRNLSVHPSLGVLALMDEVVDPTSDIPQGYMIDEFEEEGLMLEGVVFPFDLFAMMMPQIGMEYQQVVARYMNTASFGVMVCDTSRGRVIAGPGGKPLPLYYLNRADINSLLRGAEIMTRVYLAAGAREVRVMINGWKPMRSLDDLNANLARRVSALDIDLGGYHPLGTCRMSGNRADSVCDPYGELWDTPNLFVADGSIIPPGLGVNPQITISAVAARIGNYIDNRFQRRGVATR